MSDDKIKGLVWKEVGDENFELKTSKGKHLASFNHDEDGWQGIGKGEDVARAIAKEFKIPFEVK